MSSGMTDVGKYRIIDQIGEGAMGVVYRAHDPVLNRPVAIKVMADSVARDDDLRGRFLREAQAAGSLQHPNVVTIYDFGEVDGHLFIAMEFVAGLDLEDIHKREVPLTLLQKVDILIDVLGGLAYAHKRGIIHRDIKPANIRIDEDGRARIMDFGIAHLNSSKMTKTGITFGTPAYMAPEQISSAEITPATDIFSVGAVMFELFAGRQPFAGESLHSVFFNIISAPAPSLDADVPGLPPALNVIMQKALAKDPAERYPTAIAMANALTPVRRELDSLARQSKSVSLRSQIDEVLTTRPTVVIPETAAPKRRMVYAAAGGVALLAVVALAVLRPWNSSNVPADAPSLVVSSVAPPSASATPPPPPTSPAPIIQASPNAAATPPTKQAPAADAARTAREVEALRSIQSIALDARRRATEAGATAGQLKPGDDDNERALTLAVGGKATEAAVRLNMAMRSWQKAEADARAAAAASKSRAAEPEKLPTPVVTAGAPPVTTPPPATPPVAPLSTPIPAATAAAPLRAAVPAAEIATVVSAYARAISSRDINEVRRAYPGVTPAQASGFEQFFSSTRSLQATLAVSALDIQATTAEGRVDGTYEYVTTGGKSERQPVAFQATFRRDGSTWKLVSVRSAR